MNKVNLAWLAVFALLGSFFISKELFYIYEVYNKMLEIFII